MSPSRKTSSASRSSRKKGQMPVRRWSWLPGPIMVVGGILVLILIGLSGGTVYALNLENHDSFCASCHTQPETDYVAQSLQSTPQTLAAFHAQKSVNCIDCHSGSGVFGRVVGLEQGTQDLVAYMSGNYHVPAVTTYPIEDPSCLKCHQDILARRDFNNHFHLFLARWQSVDANAAQCITCHTSHSNGSDNHVFLQNGPVEHACDGCHRMIGE